MIEMVSAALPFSCEQMFDLAADIEKYPEFVHGWISTRITRRDGCVCDVDQTLGLGPIELRFKSRAVLDRPRRIDVTSTDRAFRKYAFSWRISAFESSVCHIRVMAEIELQSRLLQAVAMRLMPEAVAETLRAFERRAHALYDPPTE